jgi:hypothetical protein
VGAGVAPGVDGEVWAFADLEEIPNPSKATQVSAGMTRNIDFAVIDYSVF